VTVDAPAILSVSLVLMGDEPRRAETARRISMRGHQNHLRLDGDTGHRLRHRIGLNVHWKQRYDGYVGRRCRRYQYYPGRWHLSNRRLL
jgi:hypothetical protein